LKILTADFETTTDAEDCRVWAYGITEVGNTDYFEKGLNIDSFVDYCERSDNSKIYFHNLAFDGTFILIWLFNHGFKHVIDKEDITDKTFTTLISNKGLWYSIKIYFKKANKKVNTVTINDSLKIIPFSVADIAKSFGLPFFKGEIDYDNHNGEITPVTDEEWSYLERDVKIPAMALDILFKQGLTKMTTGSNALSDYKDKVTQKKFEKWFPVPYYDSDVRQSYKGGFTFVNPLFQDSDIDEGIVLDVNSLYPSVMRNRPLPYGEGVYFNGKYETDSVYSLYTQMLTCQFVLKKDHIPSIQLKGNSYGFGFTEYLTTSGEEEVTMCLTSVDLDLFFQQYDVYNITYHSGWKFKATTGLFTEYIDYWTEQKINAKREHNKGMYQLSKLMLNSLYGKFSTSPKVQSKIPFLHDNTLKFTLGEEETKNPVYIPVGTFITSWARYTTITSAQKVYHRFLYADTDSLHLKGFEVPADLEIDDYELGKWKLENKFMRARFIRQKSYFECHIVDDETYNDMEEEDQAKCYIYNGVRVVDVVTCAGMPNNCKQHVNWDNFHIGQVFDGKLQKKNVKGGIILNDTTFELKEKKKLTK
jgi:hypothetical protein